MYESIKNNEEKSQSYEMKSTDVIEFVEYLATHDIPIWIDGGWGVDALVEEQTRPHGDLDIVVESVNILKLRALLHEKGYKDVERDDTSEKNFLLGDSEGHIIDVHVITFDEEGNGIYGPREEGSMYSADSLTGIGLINGAKVRCISAEWMMKFHTGYELDEKDFNDVKALNKKFGIKIPKECESLIDLA